MRNGVDLITKCKYLFAKFFDDSLEKIPSYDGIVYRMDNPNADADFELAWFAKNIGKNILLRHYLSTSIERWDNRPITWEIRTLNNGSFGKDIIELNTTEKEVLFKRNSKFTIIKVESSTVFMREIEKASHVDIELTKDYTGFQKTKL